MSFFKDIIAKALQKALNSCSEESGETPPPLEARPIPAPPSAPVLEVNPVESQAPPLVEGEEAELLSQITRLSRERDTLASELRTSLSDACKRVRALEHAVAVLLRMQAVIQKGGPALIDFGNVVAAIRSGQQLTLTFEFPAPGSISVGVALPNQVPPEETN